MIRKWFVGGLGAGWVMLVAVACGQKGPLYLPTEQAQPPAAAAPTQPERAQDTAPARTDQTLEQH